MTDADVRAAAKQMAPQRTYEILKRIAAHQEELPYRAEATLHRFGLKLHFEEVICNEAIAYDYLLPWEIFESANDPWEIYLYHMRLFERKRR